MAVSDTDVAADLADRQVTVIPIPTTTSDLPLTTKPCLLVGWSLRETTGSAGAVAEFEGSQSTSGPKAGVQSLASNASGSFQVAEDGGYCPAGLLLHVISGSVAGCAYVRV